ncbi:SDR family oxidoreductase [Sphaerisporangium corydalis]|uniref:SDR family oxidoreductase n=1 Tax=Sphaerisporangium corydalis TaxID=1441875 RepID=A0ABV9EA80_9ACTN|nr:NAD(P)H-binding protein [Sphaerisporangium corydalis]
MILVTGATGHVGRELVTRLLTAGERVRAFTRDPSRARGVLPAGAEVLGGDLTTGDGLPDALRGVDGVFLFLDATRSATGAAGPAATMIAASGVTRVAALSSASAAGDPGNLIAAGHLIAEAALADAGLAATLLRPGEFMSNALQWAPAIRSGEVLRIPFLDLRSAVVDPADIAAVASVSLLRPGHEGKIHPISGGEYQSARDRVGTLARVLDLDITVEEVSEAEHVERMSRYMPAFVVEAVLDLVRQARELNLPEKDWLLPTVRDLTGRAPRTFAEWATGHAAFFRP